METYDPALALHYRQLLALPGAERLHLEFDHEQLGRITETRCLTPSNLHEVQPATYIGGEDGSHSDGEAVNDENKEDFVQGSLRHLLVESRRPALEV